MFIRTSLEVCSSKIEENCDNSDEKQEARSTVSGKEEVEDDH